MSESKMMVRGHNGRGSAAGGGQRAPRGALASTTQNEIKTRIKSLCKLNL